MTYSPEWRVDEHSIVKHLALQLLEVPTLHYQCFTNTRASTFSYLHQNGKPIVQLLERAQNESSGGLSHMARENMFSYYIFSVLQVYVKTCLVIMGHMYSIYSLLDIIQY